METNPEASFEALPKEIKQLIFSHFSDAVEIIKIQATCRLFQSLIWRSITSLDFSGLLNTKWEEGNWDPTYRETAPTILKRLDPAIVTELNLRGFYSKSTELDNHYTFLADFHAKLQKLSFDYVQRVYITACDIKYMEKLREVRATRIECEPNWGVGIDHNTEFFEQIPSHVRIMHYAPEALEEVNKLNYNYMATDYVRLGEEELIRFPSAKQVACGLSFSDKNIVGFEDGTVVVYKYDKGLNSLTELSTITTLHQGRINQITQVQQKIIIASSDCKVSVSDLNDTGLVPINVITFTEPIYLVQFIDTTKNDYLAAGKRTVYVSVDGIIVKQRSYDSEVTGMSYSTYGYEVATRDMYYHGPGTLKLEEIDDLTSSNQPTPNMSISPDGSLRLTATKRDVSLYDVAGSVLLYGVPGSFDDGMHLQTYCPVDYWITLSTGHAIWTLDLQVKQVIKKISPQLSEAEMRQGNFPTIRGLWYEAESAAIFAIYSDNTLRWWKIDFGPSSYYGLEKKRKEEASLQPPADPITDPNPQGGTEPTAQQSAKEDAAEQQ